MTPDLTILFRLARSRSLADDADSWIRWRCPACGAAIRRAAEGSRDTWVDPDPDPEGEVILRPSYMDGWYWPIALPVPPGWAGPRYRRHPTAADFHEAGASPGHG